MRGDGSCLEIILSWGIIDGRLRSGGAGIGDGGSSSSGILAISLVRLHVALGLLLFRLGFLFGLL
jgi:hypothetical protein